MSDIFISHHSSDARVAEALAAALRAHDFSVWYDDQLTPGSRYRDEIKEHLDAARCVIVIWSRTSVVSDWVRDEAEHARKRRCLVPVSIADTAPPMGFGEIQSFQLDPWLGAGGSIEPLLAGVRRAIGVAATPPPSTRGAWAWIAAATLGAAFTLLVVPPAFFAQPTIGTIVQVVMWGVGSGLLLQLPKWRGTLVAWSRTKLFRAAAIALWMMPWLFVFDLVTVHPTITPANATISVDGRDEQLPNFRTRLKSSTVVLSADDITTFRLPIATLFSTFFHPGPRWRVLEPEWRMVSQLSVDCWPVQCPVPVTLKFNLQDGRIDNEALVKTVEGQSLEFREFGRLSFWLHAGRYSVTLEKDRTACPGTSANIEIPYSQRFYIIQASNCAKPVTQ
jgi:hypothetical protein